MFDILSNNRFEIIQSSTAEAAAGAAANAPSDNGFDLWANDQLPNRCLILLDVTNVGTGGELDLIVQDSADGTTWDTDFITVDTIDAKGLYLIEVDDPKRYLRLNHNTTTDAVTWAAYLITYENQRRPVTQSGTAPTLTYGTGRSAKVASE